jgi:alpha/beta superfamily hydrolase
MTYEGTFNQEENTLEGTFAQGPGKFPLTFTREAVEKPTRPQDPTDFPYHQEDVTFENTSDQVTLAGTLTLPKDQEVKQVVVLVSGSGPQDRNEEVGVFNHRPFLVLSDYLTRNGIGVLRYDDRGVAASTGDFGKATSEDFSKDAEAAVEYLKSRKDLAKAKVGIAGHSEGGMIAPMVASRNKAVDFIVLLAGPGIPIDELMLLQAKLISDSQGVPTEVSDVNQKALGKAYQYLRENPDKENAELKEGLVSIFKDAVKDFPPMVQAGIGDVDKFANDEAEGLLDTWFLYFIRFNPSDYLTKTNCPVYALNGTLDLQVPSKENLEGIEKSLAEAKNKAVKIEALEGFNHMFQKATTGAVSEYSQIEETFNESVMQKIATWIQTQ